MIQAILATLSDRKTIGIGDKLPWRILPLYRDIAVHDMQHFKEHTMCHPIVMGRKTWETLGSSPLKGRGQHYIISESRTGEAGENAIYVPPTFIPPDNSWIIGGAQVYKLMLPYCDNVYQSVITMHNHVYEKTLIDDPNAVRIDMDLSDKHHVELGNFQGLYGRIDYEIIRLK